MRPHMSDEHAAIVSRALHDAGDPLTVVEWGAGGSTVQFAHQLHAAGRKFLWFALESNPNWARIVRAETAGLPVLVVEFDYGLSPALPEPQFQDALKAMPMEDYVRWPLVHNQVPSVALVDGRHRAECIRSLRNLGGHMGTVLLHDAERPEYHAACEGLRITKHVDSHGDHLWEMRP